MKNRVTHNAPQFKSIPESEWPEGNRPDNLVKVLLNQNFMVQQYREKNSIRLSICRVKAKHGKWIDKITWDELQHIKRMIGFGNKYAIEVYPPDENIVNVANMRHLWIPSFDIPIGFHLMRNE